MSPLSTEQDSAAQKARGEPGCSRQSMARIRGAGAVTAGAALCRRYPGTGPRGHTGSAGRRRRQPRGSARPPRSRPRPARGGAVRGRTGAGARHGGAARRRARPERLPGLPPGPGRLLLALAARGADGRPGRAGFTGVVSHRRHNVPPARGLRLGDVCVPLLLDTNTPFLSGLPPAASPEVLHGPLAPRADDLQRRGHRAVHHRLRDVRGRRAAHVLAAVGLQPQSRRLLLRLRHHDHLRREHLLQLPCLERAGQQRGHQPSDRPRVRGGQQSPATGHPAPACARLGGLEPRVPPGLVLGPACAGSSGQHWDTWMLPCGF